MESDFIRGTGRRKTAVAQVRLFTEGDGNVEVNGKPLDKFFPLETQRMRVMRPLLIAEKQENVKIIGQVHGGGLSAQAGALSHGISRALLKLDGDLRPILKKEGLLTFGVPKIS